jgi:hypothetical protein
VYHPQNEEGLWTMVQCGWALSFDSVVPRETKIITPVIHQENSQLLICSHKLEYVIVCQESVDISCE